jgi:hypothetical protein
MSTITTAGATPIRSRRALVESLASMATLQTTMTATAANQPPKSQVREILVNMISTLLQVGLD